MEDIKNALLKVAEALENQNAVTSVKITITLSKPKPSKANGEK